jgi:hypothetical protein
MTAAAISLIAALVLPVITAVIAGRAWIRFTERTPE